MGVAVVGGGAVGVTAALHLAERDRDVVLYERDELGSGSTGRAAGICYDAFAEDVDARVGARALRRFRELGLLRECPYVWLARDGDESTADAIEGQVARMRDHGRNVALVDPATLGERYPQLRTDDVAVAAVAREAGLVDPGEYVALVADRMRKRGVDVRLGTPASLDSPTTVAADDGTTDYDAVVVAAGPATADVVAGVGVSLALKTYRAQALVTDSVRATLPAAYDATTGIYWRPSDGGYLVGDGTHEVDPTDWERDADDDFVESALDRFASATTLGPSVDRAWAGLCTATPDRNPLLGAVTDGCFVATGWHGHGFMRAPALGVSVVEQVLGEDGIDGFDPTRFDGDESFDVVEGLSPPES